MTTIQRYKKREMTKKIFNKNLPPQYILLPNIINPYNKKSEHYFQDKQKG